MMITESPCLIRAARRWSSDMPYNRIFSARDPSLSMHRQLTVLFNAFSTPVILPQAARLCQGEIILFFLDPSADYIDILLDRLCNLIYCHPHLFQIYSCISFPLFYSVCIQLFQCFTHIQPHLLSLTIILLDLF